MSVDNWCEKERTKLPSLAAAVCCCTAVMGCIYVRAPSNPP